MKKDSRRTPDELGPSVAQAGLQHAAELRRRGAADRADLVRGHQMARMVETETTHFRKRERAFREALLGPCRELVRGTSTTSREQRDARLRLLGLMDDLEREAVASDRSSLVLVAEAAAILARTIRQLPEDEPPAGGDVVPIRR